MYVEVKRLSRLAAQLLILARADAGALDPTLEPIDVADLLHEVAALWSPVAQEQDAYISVVAPDSGSVEADPVLIRRVLDNLIDNGIRHTPRSTGRAEPEFRRCWPRPCLERGYRQGPRRHAGTPPGWRSRYHLPAAPARPRA